MSTRCVFRAALCSVAAAVAFVIASCQPAVREDRTITFGPDGQVTFQHGRNGVFVTDPKTGQPHQIYDPAPEDLAFSPPIWDATGQRALFTVARALDGSQPTPMGDTPGEGQRYAGVPIRYTCWLYDRTTDKPVKLFEASANHAGYVAAGLAVAWHLDGRRLDYIDRVSEKQHRAYSFDLTSRQTYSLTLSSAENIAFGSDPHRTCRYAMLGGAGSDSGLWLENNGTWWRVQNSQPETPHLATLRQRLPRWSRDGKKLAFTDDDAIRVCNIASKQTETWFHFPDAKAKAGDHPDRSLTLAFITHPSLSDNLHWHPDNNRLAIINDFRLGLVGPTQKLEPLTTKQPVVAFAGWDASGKQMAYVTAEPLPYSTGEAWATLFVPNPNARLAVTVADMDGTNPKVMVSGLRATFLNWSPTEPKLSVWLTIEPPYRLADYRMGMPPGDPAAIINTTTGKLEWLPVNGTEHSQIGHVELRTGHINAALHRFDDAAAALPPDGKTDWMLFRALAFQKAGREADARIAWERFTPPAPRRHNEALEAHLKAIKPEWPIVSVGMIHPRHQFIAEGFVSLDMANEAIAFFQEEIGKATSDAEKLSAVVSLCQLYLLTDKKEEYARCVVDKLLPLARRVLTAQSAVDSVAWTLLPLAVGEFVDALPEQLVRQVSEAVNAWPQGTNDVNYACQLVLRTCGQRLKDAGMIATAKKRIAEHETKAWWKLPANDEVTRMQLMVVKGAFLAQEMMIEHFANAFGFAQAPTNPERR